MFRIIIQSKSNSNRTILKILCSSSTSLPSGTNVREKDFLLTLFSFRIAVQAFVLNFNGRVDKASVKNFQLIDEYDDNKIYMQFGRIGQTDFNMDVAYPCSLFQAFGIALTLYSG